jgi:hypothetical protein
MWTLISFAVLFYCIYDAVNTLSDYNDYRNEELSRRIEQLEDRDG